MFDEVRLVRRFGEAHVSEALIEIKLHTCSSQIILCVLKSPIFLGLSQPGPLHEGVKVDGKGAGL